MNALLFFVIFILFIVVFALTLPVLDKEFQRFYFQKIHWRNHIRRTEFLKVNSYLEKNNSYYANLDEYGRGKFINRILYYLQNWEFEGRQDLEVTIEMKLLIASSAAQLTFGHAHFEIPFIKKIAIYPSSFYSKLLRAEINGAVYPQDFGLVALSWDNVQRGFEDSRDTFNLALHEMAHALIINDRKENDRDFAVELFAQRFIKKGYKQYMGKLVQGRGHLRDYAATNEMEFFALCIEAFFETPAELSIHLPELYHGLCILLNQNPLNSFDNFRLEPSLVKKAMDRWPRFFPGNTKYIRTGRLLASEKLLSFLMVPGFAIFFIDMNLYEGSPKVMFFAFLGGLVFMQIKEWTRIRLGVMNPSQYIWSLLHGMAVSCMAILILSVLGLHF